MLRMKWATSSGLTAPPMIEDIATLVDFLPVRPDSTSSTINSTGIDWPAIDTRAADDLGLGISVDRGRHFFANHPT